MTNVLESRSNRRRALLGGVAIMISTNACGYLLYPERRGRTHGRIDLPVLIIDLLWLLPGLLPGVVCLVVDFTTGCIYEGGASAANDPSENPQLTTAEVELDGRVVARGELDTDRRAQLSWAPGTDEASVRARGRLVLRRADGRVAASLISDLI